MDPSLGSDYRDHARQAHDLAAPLREPDDLAPLADLAGDARVVLIGEASHGTSEYYRWRADLTRRLLTEHGFDFVAVEGDWPECRAVDRWVKGGTGGDALAAVEAFRRWPTWMWANHEVADFLTWLRRHNQAADAGAGFYGLDVYSLRRSLEEIRDYLDRVAPEAVPAALEAFACFDAHGTAEHYARAQALVPDSCQDEVVEVLHEVRRASAADGADADADFDARQNALVLEDAERYYRVVVRGGPESWNIRDTHMADTLDRLLDAHGPEARGVVWAHNTHVGDARFTDMADAGLTNLGTLARERHGEDRVLLVGFGSFAGTVAAAPGWGESPEETPVPAAVPGSHEDVIRTGSVDRPSLFLFRGEQEGWPTARRRHRAIGVVYQPEREAFGNWVPTVIGRRYDAFLYLPHTTALRPVAGLSPRRVPPGPVI